MKRTFSNSNKSDSELLFNKNFQNFKRTNPETARKKIQKFSDEIFNKLPELAKEKDSQYFLFWLIGFFNRKGSFYLKDRTPVFSLEHKEDPELLLFISKKIKAGKVFKQSLAFQSQADVYTCITILNGFIFEKEKLEKFSKLVEIFNSKTQKKIILKQPSLSWFNSILFFHPFLIGFIEAGQNPFSFNYNARICTIFPYISLFSKKCPNLIKLFKRLLTERKIKRIAKLARGRRHLEKFYNYPKHSLFLEGFKSQAPATASANCEQVLQILHYNKIYGKKNESFKAFFKLATKIKSMAILPLKKRKEVFEIHLREVIDFLEEYNKKKIQTAKKTSKFYKAPKPKL